MYTEEELGEVRDTLAGKRKLSTQEIEILRNEFRDNQIPKWMYPFVGLFATNLDLYRKISGDARAQKYSFFGFFPETFDLVYGSEVSPEISFDGGNRGLVGIIKHPTKKVVVKPTQNSREQEVAQIADELGIGPKQYTSISGFLTEQFVEGELFSMLRGDRTSADNIYHLGRRMGEILSKLHSREIYYNDDILTDDLGRSHVIIPETSPAVLFDYGVALRLDQHPDFSDEEVYNFARTLPMVGMFLGREPSQEQVQSLVQEYRPKLQIATKQQIIARDINFINGGLTLATYRLGNHIVEPFLRGFKETYKFPANNKL
ncbi:hypothetical protein HYX08_04485 [Candidatus Woesearchaeota archaeon]|nr:hypothetical protein [Candidatus Woesearchaeota archaeon]